jgi:hypothetical protein
MGANYLFDMKNNEIRAPTFFKHNNSFEATVLRRGRNGQITQVVCFHLKPPASILPASMNCWFFVIVAVAAAS